MPALTLGMTKKTQPQRLTSYAGIPVVPAETLGLNKYFSESGSGTAGMAWGGKTNPPGQGGGQPMAIVVNPNYFKDDNVGYNSLIKLEASRHWMNENAYDPKFKITPEMQKWREQKFANAGEAGKSYATDDKAFRQTILSRVIGGDPNIPKLPESVVNEAKKVNEMLSKSDFSKKIQSAIDIKK